MLWTKATAIAIDPVNCHRRFGAVRDVYFWAMVAAAAVAVASLRIRIRGQEEKGMLIYSSYNGLAITLFRCCCTKFFFCKAYSLACSCCVVGGLRKQT